MGVYESKIEQSLSELRMDAIDFAELCGINRTILSSAFRGRYSFTGPETLRLVELIRELKQVQADAEPFTLSWKDSGRVKKLLELRRSGVRVYTQFSPLEDHDEAQ